MDKTPMKAFRAQVFGTVQGVGFRYATLDRARRLGLCGYVRNKADGSVEVAVEGEATVIDSFRQWLSHGPPGATVREVRVTELPYSGNRTTFSIE